MAIKSKSILKHLLAIERYQFPDSSYSSHKDLLDVLQHIDITYLRHPLYFLQLHKG